jgi:hypothetical protein
MTITINGNDIEGVCFYASPLKDIHLRARLWMAQNLFPSLLLDDQMVF